jgi:hypothetical protein
MMQTSTDRPVSERRAYFVRFFGLARAFRVNGFGGEFNIVRNRSSVRFSPSSRGNKSIDSAFRLLGVRRFVSGGFAFIGRSRPWVSVRTLK